MALNPNIKLFAGRSYNTKASEEYVHVRFNYPDVKAVWDGWVPVEYRRTGIHPSLLLGRRNRISTGPIPDPQKLKIFSTLSRMENGIVETAIFPMQTLHEEFRT